MKFYTRSEARSAATRAQAKSKHIMLDSVLNEAIKNQEMQNRFDIFLSHAIKDADLILGVKTLLEESGFTVYVDWIIDPSLEREFKVENHLAWPLHLVNNLNKWKAKYDQIISHIKYSVPHDLESEVDQSKFLQPVDVHDQYVWSRCLTFMRESSISKSDIRILAGGKSKGYKGKMPGVLEEFLISIEHNKPIYLVGGLGGITRDICMAITGQNHIPEVLTLDWQLANNQGYNELVEYLSTKGYEMHYPDIVHKIQNIDINQLASSAGLSLVDYKKLMETPFIDEIIHLILKGMKEIS